MMAIGQPLKDMQDAAPARPSSAATTADRKVLEPTVFELSSPGRSAFSLPACDVPEQPIAALIPSQLQRSTTAELPEMSELQVVRHFTRLSQLNYSIDGGFYPLGSCTMKYNPKLHEDLVADPRWSGLHPHQPDSTVQGVLALLFRLQEYLCEIGGMDAFTLQPAAGAHGELTGLMIIRAFHESRGDHRSEVLVPDTAHGTNPASAAAAGYSVVQVNPMLGPGRRQRFTPVNRTANRGVDAHQSEYVRSFREGHRGDSRHRTRCRWTSLL